MVIYIKHYINIILNIIILFICILYIYILIISFIYKNLSIKCKKTDTVLAISYLLGRNINIISIIK